VHLTKDIIDVISAQPGTPEPPSNIPPSGGDGDEPPPGDFNAFPRLDAPDELQPRQEFTAIVGFRPDPDPKLASSHPLHVEDPAPNATIILLFTALGARVLNERREYRLPLTIEAREEIQCVVEEDARQVTLFADYVYDSQLI